MARQLLDFKYTSDIFEVDVKVFTKSSDFVMLYVVILFYRVTIAKWVNLEAKYFSLVW